MMAVRLRYLAHDLEVPAGQFVIGRSPDCQLSLDDPLVSRRHALLTVRQDSVTLEDLGSRNGVFVNGVRIANLQGLALGDKITIGTQEMWIEGGSDVLIEMDSIPYPSTPSIPKPARVPTHVRHALEEVDISETTDKISLEMVRSGDAALARPPHPDKRVHSLHLIGNVADKALALGRVEEAERLLVRSLSDISAKVRDTGQMEPELALHAAQNALRLASATGKAAWVDYVFEIYGACRQLLPASIVDELYKVIRKVRAIDMAQFRAYTTVLREQSGAYNPGERFIQQRIEGLERLAR
jgi:hypothetical protein